MRLFVVGEKLHYDLLGTRHVEWGYETCNLKFLSEVAAHLEKDPSPAIVLADWVVDAPNVEACRTMRRKWGDHCVYILLVLNSTDEQSAMTGLEVGADDLLYRPLKHSELRSRLAAGRRMLEYEKSVRTMENQVKKAQAILQQTAAVDELTGLLNQRFFKERMRDEWRRGQRDEWPISLILADIDFLGEYNTSRGFQAGDECLRQVAGIFTEKITRAGDVVAHFDGGQYAVLLPNTDKVGATIVAETVRVGVSDLAIRHDEACGSCQITISLGTATLKPGPGLSPSDLLESAAAALRRAKQSGRNRVQ